MKADILLFGSKGQLGKEINNQLKNNYKIISLHKKSIRYEGNFLNEKSLIKTIRSIKPKIIINAAAYTAVDDAENNKKITKLINTSMPHKIAIETKKINALLIHFSSDYVYSGTGQKPWTEKNKMIPINYYGASKAWADKRIINSGCNYVIIRSSWIYSANGKNFLDTMIRFAKKNETINMINDQVGAPTSTSLLAKVVKEVVKNYYIKKESSRFLNNIFHIAPKGFVSWYKYSLEVLNYLEKYGYKVKLKQEKVISMKSREYRQKAKRPLNSRLNINKAKKMFDLKFPPWQEDLHQILKIKLEKKSYG